MQHTFFSLFTQNIVFRLSLYFVTNSLSNLCFQMYTGTVWFKEFLSSYHETLFNLNVMKVKKTTTSTQIRKKQQLRLKFVIRGYMHRLIILVIYTRILLLCCCFCLKITNSWLSCNVRSV
jgi:hypothetical protein